MGSPARPSLLRHHSQRDICSLTVLCGTSPGDLHPGPPALPGLAQETSQTMEPRPKNKTRTKVARHADLSKTTSNNLTGLHSTPPIYSTAAVISQWAVLRTRGVLDLHLNYIEFAPSKVKPQCLSPRTPPAPCSRSLYTQSGNSSVGRLIPSFEVNPGSCPHKASRRLQKHRNGYWADTRATFSVCAPSANIFVNTLTKSLLRTSPILLRRNQSLGTFFA